MRNGDKDTMERGGEEETLLYLAGKLSEDFAKNIEICSATRVDVQER